MKKLAVLLTTLFLLVACKSENKDSESTETVQASENVVASDTSEKRYRGEFIYVADGAVLKGSNFIYGVTINAMAEELKNRVAPVKNDTYDMVPVIVKGTLAKKDENDEGWDEILTITEIVDVSKTPAEADIKIEDNKN